MEIVVTLYRAEHNDKEEHPIWVQCRCSLFILEVFDLWLVEPMDREPSDVEGRLHREQPLPQAEREHQGGEPCRAGLCSRSIGQQGSPRVVYLWMV